MQNTTVYDWVQRILRDANLRKEWLADSEQRLAAEAARRADLEKELNGKVWPDDFIDF
jgi:hypothetical protein